MANPSRPRCPHCQRELVEATLVIGETSIIAWLCDCDEQAQPIEIRCKVVKAREWLNQRLIFTITVEPDA